MNIHERRALLHGLYVITDENAPGGHRAMARAALRGGARIIQLRDKSATSRQLLSVAHHLRQLTRESNALLIINDRCDLAMACEADGVHLGPDDLPPSDARRILGAEMLIGVSCGDEDEARAAHQSGADYVGAGAVFGTQTKLDAGAAIGLDALQRIVRATSLPVAAIGGINLENISDVMRTGAAMACVVSAVSGAKGEAEMKNATAKFVAALEETS